MCATCGCDGVGGADDIGAMAGDAARPRSDHQHSDQDGHADRADHAGHAHPHADHSHSDGTETVSLQTRVLAKNDALAAANRELIERRGLTAVNLMSSPGSGKTTLLARTITDIGARVACYVVEGDQETTLDADRIAATGAPVFQVNTGAGCHLDAGMLADALRALDPTGGLLLIENVGNLVCPALFDLGEHARAVIMSVTEGADKPLKYPQMFHAATVVLLNKVDLLPYVDFDVAAFRRDLASVNPRADVLPVSATAGDGLDGWYGWLGSVTATTVAAARS